MQQLSAEYVYAVTGGQEGGEDHEPGPLFTEFMNMRTTELREQGVSEELAETLAEDEWFAPAPHCCSNVDGSHWTGCDCTCHD
jgi:hypothetical protein